MDNYIFLEKLNDEQKDAILFNNGPLFVVAGAGTGKTRTLTNKVAYLYKMGISPYNMLVLTFTNKAAKEMQQRVNKILNLDINFPNISTFHSFAYKFLKENINFLGRKINSDFSIADESDSKKIIKDIIDEDIKIKKDANAIYKDISNYKIKNITPTSLDNFDEILKKYEEVLEKNNLIDFDNLLLFTKEILEKNDSINKKYSTMFTNILVDEFQDTDKIQYEILKLLCKDNIKKNIFVVGDPDQSIYSFRGAAYENNDNFIKDFKSKILTLNKNYRSTSNILDCANNLISYNNDRSTLCKDKMLVGSNGLGSNVIIQVFDKYLDEAKSIAKHIKYLIVAEKVKPSDIAILIRSNYLSRIFEEELIFENIPYIIYGDVSFFQRKEIKDLIAYLKLIINPNQDYYLKRIINTPKRQIGKTTIENLIDITKRVSYEKNIDISIYEAINFFESGKTKEKLLNFKNIIEDIRNKFKNSFDIYDSLLYFIDKIEYYKYLSQIISDDSSYKDKIDLIDQLFNNIVENSKKYDKDKNSLELVKLALEEIELLTDIESDNSFSEKVIISTFHQVKGLEFDTVIMPAMEEQIIPNSIILKNETDELDEERRIAYVGITRAKKRLIMSYSKSRWRFGKWNNNEPSRFLNEAKKIYDIEKTSIPEKTNNKIVSNPKIKKETIFGKKVYHPTFGNGKIIDLSDSNIATIVFEKEVGIKKISISFPGLEIFF